MVELVDSYFPEWANLYHSLPFNIQRLDMIRYMILYCHGGVYVDLDIECFKSIDPLVENKSFFLGMEPPEHWVCFNGSKQRVVGNAFMGSSNNHKGWLRILSDIDFTVKNRIYRDDIVLNTTGPYMLSRLINQLRDEYGASTLSSYLVSPVCKEDFQNYRKGVCSDLFYGKIKNAFCAHYFFGAWDKKLSVYKKNDNTDGTESFI